MFTKLSYTCKLGYIILIHVKGQKVEIRSFPLSLSTHNASENYWLDALNSVFQNMFIIIWNMYNV